MKERIVIDNNQHLPRASYYVAKDGHYDVGTVNYATPETILNENRIVAVKEQVPETFEELKELCKNLKSKFVTIYNNTITIDFPSINGGNNFYIHITEKEIDINISIFAQNRTIPQLWAFIKSLIGEE